jgi:hypothetical protein
MTQTDTSIVVSKTKDNLKRKQLIAVIRKKRTELKNIILSNETLRVNLDMARQEYMVKVGSLFLKDNTLDLEIIRLQNILRLMEEGYSFERAAEELDQTYYAEQLKFDQEKARIKFEEEIYIKREEQKPHITPDLKKLWKKLIAKFHPDLTQNPIEKNRRTNIMKEINKAYEEGDYTRLLRVEKENASTKETTIENLEDILLNFMREVDEQYKLKKELIQSEWYDWMVKIEIAKKKDKDIFADTERRLLDDIVSKFELIKSLKKQIKERETGLILL